MRVKDFDYALPQELIAQTPAEPRDSSRMMVLRRGEGNIEHRIFRDIVEYIRPEDVLVVNNTKVMPARLFGHREDTGGKIEFLLLKRVALDTWEVILQPGRRAQVGVKFVFGNRLFAEIIDKTASGGRIVKFSYDGVFEDVLNELGHLPLPPYIHETPSDESRYQTVYAKETGSAAAPTAGLHFTPELLQAIRHKGAAVAEILLHVGLGTFRPVKVENVQEHVMHSEYFEVTEAAANVINERREHDGRVIAVGTTTARVLESVHDGREIVPQTGETDIFIYPGYAFKAVDAMATNFHLPQSTLLMMVSAFAGQDIVKKAYSAAVKEKYRFFSFGDCMLIIN